MLLSIRGHHILTCHLGPGSCVLDSGAHWGEFSPVLRMLYGSRCYGLEPNRELLDRLPDEVPLNFGQERPKVESTDSSTSCRPVTRVALDSRNCRFNSSGTGDRNHEDLKHTAFSLHA
jgi:hypothetical protein